MMKNRANERNAFTLVELLVVIGIIALLISILLPSLNKARKAANTVKCAANLRTMCQGMQLYAAENKGYIIGAPVTTGSAFFNPSATQSNLPDMMSIWDWQTPMLKMFGARITYSTESTDPGHSGGQANFDRANFIMSYGAFNCPERQGIIAPYYTFSQPSTIYPGVANAPSSVQMPSYLLSMLFLWMPSTADTSAYASPQSGINLSGFGKVKAYSFYSPPDSYVPNLSKVGAASEKIFVSDGARYLKYTPAGNVDVDYTAGAGGGAAWAEIGPWSKFSSGHVRIGAPANGGTNGKPDERTVWAPHGGINSNFRFNAGFFDGHVATMGDLDGSNPKFWMPKGSNVVAGETYADVIATYGVGTTAFTMNQ